MNDNQKDRMKSAKDSTEDRVKGRVRHSARDRMQNGVEERFQKLSLCNQIHELRDRARKTKRNTGFNPPPRRGDRDPSVLSKRLNQTDKSCVANKLKLTEAARKMNGTPILNLSQIGEDSEKTASLENLNQTGQSC